MPIVSKAKVIAAATTGEVISFPTDTVPALAVKPNFAERIFNTKKRPAEKSLILMGASSQDLFAYTLATEKNLAVWQEIARQHWPGALTLVLPASPLVPLSMHLKTPDTIGLRIPNSAIALEVLRETGPLATTSANLSGSDPLLTATAIADAFPDVIILAPPPNPSSSHQGSSGLPSTVIKWQDNHWKVLRQGAVQFQQSC